jgi:hypothetical protein
MINANSYRIIINSPFATYFRDHKCPPLHIEIINESNYKKVNTN